MKRQFPNKVVSLPEAARLEKAVRATLMERIFMFTVLAFGLIAVGYLAPWKISLFIGLLIMVVYTMIIGSYADYFFKAKKAIVMFAQWRSWSALEDLRKEVLQHLIHGMVGCAGMLYFYIGMLVYINPSLGAFAVLLALMYVGYLWSLIWLKNQVKRQIQQFDTSEL